MRRLVCFLLATCALDNGFPPAGAAEGSPAVLEISTDMLQLQEPRTELVLGWQQDINAGFHLGLDAVTRGFALEGPDRLPQRAAALAAFSGVSLIVNQAFSLTAHDERHMEAARAIGSSDVSLVSNSGKPMSLGLFFLQAFDFTAEPGLYTYDPPADATPADEARVRGAGLNTNLLTASRIARQIDERGGHVTDLAPYLLNKLWGIPYFRETGPDSDAAAYMDLVAEQGYHSVTAARVIGLSAASCVLSGGFLSLAGATWRYIADADAAATPLGLTLGPVRILWPEMTAWLNPDNVSVDATVDAAWGTDVLLRAGADVPALGNVAASPELTIGATVRIRPVRLGMELTSNGRGVPFLQGSAEIAVGERVSVGVEGFYGQGTTMREAREHPLGPGANAFLRTAL